MASPESGPGEEEHGGDGVAHGETLTGVPTVRICVLPPVPITSMRREVQEMAGDWTLADVADATKLPLDGISFSIDGEFIPRDRWAATIPTPGQSIILSTRPGGIEIGLAVAAALELTGVAAAVVVGVVTIGLVVGISLLAQALLAPASPNADAAGTGIRRTIAGSSNQFQPYATLPQVLGEHRMYPPLAATSYTAVEDGKLYQYALFTFGHGPLTLADLKIGEDPLFTDGTTIVYTGQMESDTESLGGRNGHAVKVEIRQGHVSDAAVTLFSQNVQEVAVAQKLNAARGWVERRTIDDATNITVIIAAPSGIRRITDEGRQKEHSVIVDVEYRLVNTTATQSWTGVNRIKMTGKTGNSLFDSRTIGPLTAGTYEVRVKRRTEDSTDLGVIDEVHWTTMLVTRSGTPVKQTGLCLVAAKIKITGQFAGMVDQFNAIAQTVCLDWRSSTSSWTLRATSNPASLFRHVLQGGANKRPVANGKLNLTALAAWHVANDAKSFEFNSVTQGKSTVIDILRQIASAGRASPAIQDGLFTVVTENPLTGSPVQHFTPRNVRSFTEQRTYFTMPEAFKVQFVDPSDGWLDTERIVPDDGYTTTTASTFERLDLAGITSSAQAYKLGRYHLAVLRLRPSDYIIETDFEHLDCVRGDWVKLNHDVILAGLAAGRVVSVTMTGADCSGVVVDQECTMVAATYGVRFRKSSDGSTITKTLTTVAGNQTTLTFSTVIASGNPMPVAGDLFLFGESGSESIDCIVKSIEPLDELGARLTLVDAAAGILTADTAAIPTYSPQITLRPGMQAASKPLSKPRILSVSSADARDAEGRGPVTDRGIVVQLQGSGVSAA